jgi:dual specificity tyrosine-phosphorylation-regulated kinase 2/3/4
LPASKSHRGLASKLSIPSRITRSSTTPSLSQSHSPAPSDGGRSTSSSRYGTPLGEDDLKADDEMSEFLQRQKTRKSPSGLTEEEIARMLDFPEPIEPRVPLPPDGESGTRVTELQADD